MLIFTKIHDLRAFLNTARNKGQSIGFVPTMGALHRGHISLIEQSKKKCDLTVCSVFVNPTQFNDKKDLERYPRTPQKDAEILENGGCNVLFLPSVAEIYPKADVVSFDFGNLDKVLEGKYREGHFNGVAQVVKRFFEIVGPDKAFFGSKDYQQVMIVKKLVKLMRSEIEIVPCPVLREPDGLAMSSRNTLLTDEERKTASVIPRLMQMASQIIPEKGINVAKSVVEQELAALQNVRLDYFEVCNVNTLELLEKYTGDEKAIALIALFIGKIRLIDNLEIN